MTDQQDVLDRVGWVVGPQLSEEERALVTLRTLDARPLDLNDLVVACALIIVGLRLLHGRPLITGRLSGGDTEAARLAGNDVERCLAILTHRVEML